MGGQLSWYWRGTERKKAFASETPHLFWSAAGWEQIGVSGLSACKLAWDLLDEPRPLFIQRMREKKNEKICSLSLSLSCRSVSTHTKLKSADFHQCFSVWAATVEGFCIGAHSTYCVHVCAHECICLCLLANRAACVFHWIRCNHCIAMHGKSAHRDDIRTQCLSLRQPVATGSAHWADQWRRSMFHHFPPEIDISGRRHWRREQDWELQSSTHSPLTLYFLFQSTLVHPNSAPWCLILTTSALSPCLDPPLCLCSHCFFPPAMSQHSIWMNNAIYLFPPLSFITQQTSPYSLNFKNLPSKHQFFFSCFFALGFSLIFFWPPSSPCLFLSSLCCFPLRRLQGGQSSKGVHSLRPSANDGSLPI